MTWLASTDSVKELKAAVEELRVKMDDATQLSEMAIRSSGKVERLGQELVALQDAVCRLAASVDIAVGTTGMLRRPLLGRLSWLVTGK